MIRRWKATDKAKLSYVEMVLRFLRLLVNFENRAADFERQRPFFTKFLQTAGRNDPNSTPLERYRRDAAFSCRTHSLIPYGLRAISMLSKCGNSVFGDTQIDLCTESDRRTHCFKEETARRQMGK